MKKDLVVALSGGVGGAKLALGLSRVLPAAELMVVANTGDDFEHLGLKVSPDLDTLVYTLAGIDNPETGWGRRGESWNFMAALEALGGETWFRLGDADLAMHVERTRRLKAGEGLAAITADFCRRLGVRVAIKPMSGDPAPTRLRTSAGWLDFQDYFVRQQCRPEICEIELGAAAASPDPDFLAALVEPRLRAVVICPSNPFISIEPILALGGVKDLISKAAAPVIAVSPIIGGRAVKGPTAKIMHELGLEASAAAVAERYRDLLDAFIVERGDAGFPAAPGLRVVEAETRMITLGDREALARVVLATADRLAEAAS